jgi:phage terminase large subunit-like protein
MRGWTIDGRQVELLPWQETVVKAVLRGWHDGSAVLLPAIGRAGGKTTVLATLAKYEQAYSLGRPYRNDPRRPQS